MSRSKKVLFKVLDIFMIFMLTFGSPMSALALPSPTGATIASDSPDYLPGALVTLTGTGWQVGEAVHITVNDDANQTWGYATDVSADLNGGFTTSFTLPTTFIALYTVRATGPYSGTATTTFFDDELSWDQCQNDTDPNDNAQDPCAWTNGALNTNNSIYAEGDVVPQRHIRGVSSAGPHYTSFDHSFYDQAKDAYTYDFWATPDFTVGSDLNACNELANSLTLTLTQCAALFTAKQAIPIPSEATYTIGATTFTYPFVSGAEANAALDGVTRDLWISCGTVGGTQQNPTFTTGACSNISITILGHGNSNKALLPDIEQQGPPTADEYVQMKVAYTTPADTFVAIWVGGHLAKNSYWNEPTNIIDNAFLGYGSSYAAGASFHQRLIGWDLNSAIGNRDNQIQNSGGTIVPPGSITIYKNDTSDSGTSFDFTASSPLTPATFSLSDDGVNVNGENMQVFSDLFTSTYTINELAPDGWDLTGVSCTGTTSSYDYSSGTGVEITLQPGDNVTCTFTNSPMGGLEITKTANTSLTRTHSWTINKEADGEYWKFIGDPATSHQYTVSVNKTSVDSNWAVSGNIVITNNAPIAATITGVSDAISGDINASVSCPETFPYTLPAGQMLTCTYSASLPDATDRTNTATVTTSGTVGGGTATAPVSFATPTVTEVGSSSVNVTDTSGQSWGPVSDDTTFPSYTKEFACPTDTSLYVDGVYTAPDAVNTATITETGASDTATVKLHCYAPLVSKTAEGVYDRAYSWNITKGPDGEYDRFAGESATHGYTVSVDQTITDSAYLVAGTITVNNPNPNAVMTVSVADSLAGATLSCGGTLNVPANGSATCDYTAAVSTPTAGTNTATVALNSINFLATRDYTFQQSITGSSSVTVTDTNGESWTATGDDSWKYNETFTCSSNPADYTNGTYDIVHTNTASIDGMTDKSASATVTVHCYAPVVSKTASGSYNERHTWDITKTVNPPSQNGFAGDNLPWTWTVNLSETSVNQNFAVNGVITVVNPAPMVMTVALADVLNDTTAATITADEDCALVDGQLTIPANGTATCGYNAVPAGMTATKNTATATLGTIAFSADADVTFVKNVINGSATVTDTQIGLNQTVQAGGTYGPWTGNQSHTCSANFADYGSDGVYSGGASNTATVTASNGQTDSSSASTAYNCYAPVISKDAAGTYDERHEWNVEKTVDPESQSGFAGDALPFTWTITVTESLTDENFAVNGVITVKNTAPLPMTVDLADALDVAATVTITPDADCAFVAGKLTIPANSTATCGYTSAPGGKTAALNTATATLNSIPFTASDAVEWTANVIRGEAVVTDIQGPLNNTITESGSWTVVDSYTCSTDTTKYTSNYSYSETILNTAKVTSESVVQDSDTASTTISCFIPEISKTAAGTYGERHEWDVTKTATPSSQSAFAGDTVSYLWTVVVTEQTFEENFVVSGEITVVNHNTEDALTVALSDVVNGTDATITECTDDADLTDGLIIVAGGTAVCDYIVGLVTLDNLAGAPAANTATAKLNGISYTATDPIEWTAAPVTLANVTLDDAQNPAFPLTLTAGDTWTYTEQYTCSTNKNTYDATTHKYIFTDNNTATLKNGETLVDSSNASTAVDCYVPTISKTANGTYDEVHDWEVFKTGATAQKKFAGQTASFAWTVRVDETTHGENYLVTGDIVVTNPNPEDELTVSLNDVLDDGSVATIGPCVGGTLVGNLLTVPAGGIATCGYSVTPTGDLVDFANALPATVTMKVDYSEAGDPAYFEVVTITGNGALNGTYEGWCVDTDKTINQNTNYTANVFSSYEALPAGLVEFPQNFDLVNWIINQDFVYQPSKDLLPPDSGNNGYGESLGNYTYGDVQRAIWELIEDTPSTAGLNSWSQNRVNEIKAMAAQHEGFTPTCGDFVAVVLQPVGGQQPITIAQVTFASLGIPCADSNVVTAVLNGNSFPASATILWTPNPVNATATLDDSQNPAWPIPVSADQTFTYTDPQGYTCPSDPAAYAGDGIAPVYPDSNTATITYEGGSKSSTASTTVTCYAPIVSKTAVTEWRKKYDWTITKTADPASHIGFAGDSFTSAYDVFVDQTITDYGYLASGVITVKSPVGSPVPMAVNVTDMVSGGFAATVDCDPLTAGNQTLVTLTAANQTKTCTYTAGLPDNTSRVNTATGTFNSIGFPATANVVFGAPIVIGNPSITVNDSVQGALGLASGDRTFEYAREFSCSTTQSAYTNGFDTDTYGNIATINETGANDNASVQVDCYAPVVSKTAAGTYDERHEWDVEKTVTPSSQNVFAGSAATFDWTVTVTESIFEEHFAVTGNIIVNNPAPMVMLVDLSDVLGDGTIPVITASAACDYVPATGKLTIPANSTATCGYSASFAPDYTDHTNAPILNTGTVILNNLTATATADIGWTPTVIRPESVVTDDLGPLNKPVNSSDTFEYTSDYTCSNDTTKYTNGTYQHTVDNTAIVTSGNERDRDTASTTVNCFAPVVTKTAQTYFNRDWDWTITKDYDGSYNLFAGDTVTHGYKVTVDPTYTDNFWGVNGTITVYNYHPTADMTLTSLTDLAGGIDGNVVCSSLVVPANSSLVCTYDTDAQNYPDANPFGNLNTATAGFADADWTGTAPIAFSDTPSTEDEPVITVDDDNLTDEDWSANRTVGEWTYTKPFACSMNPADYTAGKYSYSHINTATINQTGQTDTAKVDVNCYMPQIELTKTGDALSKIGDAVNYTITLANNTPTGLGLRDLSCTISDATVGSPFPKTVTLASGASDTTNKTFTIPTTATDPFVNNASVTCSPLASTFAVTDTASASTNLFQPAVEIIKTGPAYGYYGQEITYTFTINNLSSADSPNLELASLSDTILGDLMDEAPAACDSLVSGTSCTFDVKYIVPDQGLSPQPITNVVSALYHPAGFPNNITDTDDHTVKVVPPSQATNSSLCIYDRDLNRPGQQFRALLNQDPQAWPSYRLNATNPGQFFYNVFATGNPGDTLTFNITLPYPFVTQGANPVHAYDGVTTTVVNNETCFLPGTSFYAGSQQVTLANYTNGTYQNQVGGVNGDGGDSVGTYSFPVTVTVPASGFVYVNVHLDYGLKGTAGYTNNGSGDAMSLDLLTVRIPQLADHTFSVSGAQTDDSMVENWNEFKKNPGVGGFSRLVDINGNPIAGATVTLKKGSTVLGTVLTDEDGWYQIVYKHTGKAADFTITISKVPGKSGYTLTKTVTLKANAYFQIDFFVPK